MGWSGGTYTKGNNATGGWAGDASLGIGIEAGRHDTQDDDFTAGINNCLTKDGQNTPTQNLPMGGYKHTGVANAAASDEYTTQGQLKDGSFQPNFLNPRLTGNGTYYQISNLYNVGGNVDQINVSRSGTVGVDTAVVSGNLMYRKDIQAYTGSGYVPGVEISHTCTSTPSPGDLAIGSEYQIRIGNSTGTALNVGLKIANNLRTTFPGVYALTTGAAANVYCDSAGSLLRSTSSERYKKNIEDLTAGLAEVKQLRPVTFEHKEDESGVRYAGLIAEEVDAVGLNEFVVYDSENKPDAIHYGNLVALAFKAIQELEAKVASLEAQLA